MYLICNGRLITRDKERAYFEKGAVAVEGEEIIKVGPQEELEREYPQAQVIDARGGLIMPGLINTHNHIYSAMARGLSIKGYNPKGFLDILDGMWWTIDRKLTLEQIRQSALATYVDCIKNGVTTVFDHHASYGAIEGSLFTIAQAAEELGVRTCLCYEVSDRDGQDKMRAAVKENADFISYASKNGGDMLKAMMGLHASFTLSDETLQICRDNTPEGVGFHIHVAEGIDDLHQCLRTHGKRVVNRLMDQGILGKQTIAAHCVYVNSQEMELLKETDTMVVHNPESNMGNACGCPPTLEMYRRGILVGLGTDGYTNDMMESYKVANLLHKHSLCDPNAGWNEIPSMLFEGNRAIANRYFTRPLGVLKEGAAADIVVADYNPLTPMNENNINSHLLFGINGSKIVTTMINGRLVMKDRELIGIDEEKIMADCRQQAELLWQSING